jgi:hypothetical protein
MLKNKCDFIYTMLHDLLKCSYLDFHTQREEKSLYKVSKMFSTLKERIQ